MKGEFKWMEEHKKRTAEKDERNRGKGRVLETVR